MNILVNQPKNEMTPPAKDGGPEQTILTTDGKYAESPAQCVVLKPISPCDEA